MQAIFTWHPYLSEKLLIQHLVLNVYYFNLYDSGDVIYLDCEGEEGLISGWTSDVPAQYCPPARPSHPCSDP
jgi:hypothetical protein